MSERSTTRAVGIAELNADANRRQALRTAIDAIVSDLEGVA